MDLKLKTAEECRYDAVSLGEIMLRLDPGEGRIRTARAFRAWEGAANIMSSAACGNVSACVQPPSPRLRITK